MKHNVMLLLILWKKNMKLMRENLKGNVIDVVAKDIILMIVMLLAAVLAAAVVELAELYDYFDRMCRDAKTKDVKK